MNAQNKVHHSDEQWAALAAMDVEGPVCMVNLLTFKEHAEYEDGRETSLSGMEAYGLYSQTMTELIRESGGKILHASQPLGMVVGEVDELWDAVAIVEYPSRQEFIALIESPQVQELHVHRTAGLAGQLNICTKVP